MKNNSHGYLHIRIIFLLYHLFGSFTVMSFLEMNLIQLRYLWKFWYVT